MAILQTDRQRPLRRRRREANLRTEVEDEDRVELVVDLSHRRRRCQREGMGSWSEGEIAWRDKSFAVKINEAR